jgi:hypothetical protein
MTRKKQKQKEYQLKEKQIANIILAARRKSDCPVAKKFVNKLDKKYKLKKK